MRNVILIMLTLSLVISCKRLTDEDLWNNGVDAQKMNKFDDALKDYQQIIDDHPKSPKVPDALFAIASICQDQKRDLPRAIRCYERIVKEYPTHPTASNSQFMIGYIYNNDLNDMDSAKIAYETFLNMFPDSPMAVSARFELANLGKDANQILETQTEKTPEASKKAARKPSKK
jgi:TolA-binding protein